MSERATLSFGLVGGRPVFMDERNDSYFLLESKAEAEFLSLIDRGGGLENRGSAALRSALGGHVGTSQILLARPPQAARTLLDQPEAAARPRISDAVNVALLLRRARSTISKRPIGEILRELATGAARAGGEQPRCRVPSDAGRFIAARRLVPHAPNCLRDSLALVEWLARPKGLLVVFGVKLEPFGAHCWVQLGDLLLNDRPETVARFRPVRVIECARATL